MKKWFGKRRTYIALLAFGLFLCGCSIPFDIPGKEEIPEFSEEYFVGANYGGTSFGTYYDMISAEIILCTNKNVLVFLPESVDTEAENVLVSTLTITDEQYNNIVNAIDRNKLYRLDPKPDQNVCDGYYRYLNLYDTNGEVCKPCGSYMPQNKKFNDMYTTFIENLPWRKIDQIRSEYVEKLREADDGARKNE